MVQGATIFGISPQSPLAKELIGNGEGHSFKINSVEYLINGVI
jgi:transcription elongation GreA/GreB family factor